MVVVADAATWGDYGVLALIVPPLATGVVWVIKRAYDRADRADVKADRLTDILIDRVMPALETAGAAVKAATDERTNDRIRREGEERQRVEDQRRTDAVIARLEAAVGRIEHA